MKYFGFITEHENNSPSQSIKELIKENTKPHKDKDLVLQYLKNGHLCAPIMGVVEDANDPNFGTDDYDDDKNDFFGYIAIYTDGEWYWPNYVITYIEKYPQFKIDEAFVKQVKRNKGKVPELTELRIEELDKYFMKEIWGIDG